MSDTDQQDQTDQRDADVQDQHDDSHDTTSIDDLGDKGKQAIQREREARKAAEKARADLEKRIAAFEQAQKDAEDAAAKESGKWEEIASKREQEANDLRAQLEARDREALRASIARKHRLPDDALEFVTGDDEAAIEASVKKLAKLAARDEDVDTDSGKRTSGTKQTAKNTSLLATYAFGPRR
jgi:hypothetical protein